MGSHSQSDVVWEYGENNYWDFKCNYCNCSKKGVTPHGLSSTWADVEAI
jgi:hypothetical protein